MISTLRLPSNRASRPVRIAVALLLTCLWLGTAHAQGYSLRVDLPARFVFSGDVRGITMPSGFTVGLVTDWNVGVGFERYAVEIDDPGAGIGGVLTNANYQFIDFLLEIRFSNAHLDLGLGFGEVSLDAFPAGVSTISADDGDADQFMLVLGWPLGPTWEFHVGYHEIEASAELAVNGVPSGSEIDLSGVMHSVGLKYSF